jgi:putative oxidoreductase
MAESTELPKIIPSLAWYRPFEPFAYAFIRFCSGAVILSHGAHRLFYDATAKDLGSLSHVPTFEIGGFELVGGAMLAIGLLTRPVALLLFIEWVCIAAAVPVRPGTSWLLLGATPHYPAMVAAFCFAFVLRGGGHYSLDRVIGKEI